MKWCEQASEGWGGMNAYRFFVSGHPLFIHIHHFKFRRAFLQTHRSVHEAI
uniref:Uncharacterized protein n=1 Tax=Anguilla anguilla TaxID=7936 RepID=A0A0E9VDW6_ANGAN